MGCVVCEGTGHIEVTDKECNFCNGTGDDNKAAESYMKSHICQCVFLDRKNCPVCHRKCHHDTPNKPKILVAPM